MRPLTSARNYATIADRKSKFKRRNERQKPMIESHARRKKRQPIPERVSGDGSAPPRLSVWFSVLFLLSFSWRVLGCGGAKRRRTRLCQAHAMVPKNQNHPFRREILRNNPTNIQSEKRPGKLAIYDKLCYNENALQQNNLSIGYYRHRCILYSR